MDKLSLYINHQLVSQLIKDLQNIVDICYEELDEEYETYQLRTSIYQHFILEISRVCNESSNGLKYEIDELKDEQGNLIKDEFQVKAENLKNESNEIGFDYNQERKLKLSKGRPVKHSQAENQLVSWLKSEAQNGKTKFLKSQIDSYYREFLPIPQKKKVLPLNNTLRLLKKYNLIDICVITRNGIEKSVYDLPEPQKQTAIKRKQIEDQSIQVKEEFIEDENGDKQVFYVEHYESQSQSQAQYVPFKNESIKQKSKRNLRKNRQMLSAFKKNNKQTVFPNEKFINKNNQTNMHMMMEINSNCEQSETPWQKMLNFDNDSQTQMKKVEIYQNSKSFQSQQQLQLSQEKYI